MCQEAALGWHVGHKAVVQKAKMRVAASSSVVSEQELERESLIFQL